MSLLGVGLALRGVGWHTREEARLEVFWWLEAVYNRTRRHSSLGYLSPMEYEARLSMTPNHSDPSK